MLTFHINLHHPREHKDPQTLYFKFDIMAKNISWDLSSILIFPIEYSTNKILYISKKILILLAVSFLPNSNSKIC